MARALCLLTHLDLLVQFMDFSCSHLFFYTVHLQLNCFCSSIEMGTLEKVFWVERLLMTFTKPVLQSHSLPSWSSCILPL